MAIAMCRRIAVAIVADGRGNCCGLASAEIAVAIATDRTAARAVAATVTFAVESP